MARATQKKRQVNKKPEDLQRLDTDYDPDPHPSIPEPVAQEVPGTLSHTLFLVQELTKAVPVVVLISRGVDGRPKSRPMTLPSCSFDGNVWLLTSRHSQKIIQIQQDPLVHIVYPHPQSNYYLSLEGTASLVDEYEQKRNLWAARYRSWFPDGVDDANLILLRIKIECGEYWITQPRGLTAIFSRLNSSKTRLLDTLSEHGTFRVFN